MQINFYARYQLYIRYELSLVVKLPTAGRDYEYLRQSGSGRENRVLCEEFVR